MSSIVITMSVPEIGNRIADVIRKSDIYENVILCSTGAETLRVIAAQDVSLVICSKSFSDMSYRQLVDFMPPYMNLILLTKEASLEPYGENVVRLLMPFKGSDLLNTIKMIIPETFMPRKKKPVRSEKEQKVIDEAKLILMARNDMSEPEAYRYLQKNSMDSGRTIFESAHMILLLNK